MAFSLLSLLLALLALVNSAFAATNVPLSTTGRWIVDAGGERVKLRCVNWAGHMETHLPEGLHKQSISYLADWIAGQGFNCVRLTYSIDWARNPTLAVADAFREAAPAAQVSAESMLGLYTQAVEKNPFLQNATTQDVFGEVIDQLWDRGVMTSKQFSEHSRVVIICHICSLSLQFVRQAVGGQYPRPRPFLHEISHW